MSWSNKIFQKDEETMTKHTFHNATSVTALSMFVLLSGCDSSIVERVECKTTDTNNDGQFSSGEDSEPEFDIVFKPGSCSEAVVIETEVCFMELNPSGDQSFSYDANGNRICGTWQHQTICTGGNLSYSGSTCTGGLYCNVSLSDVPPLPCGWQVQSFEVSNASSGNQVEQWTQADVEGILGEFLPPA